MKPILFSTIFILILSVNTRLSAQDVNGATEFHIFSSHTSFPDTGRAKGHQYDGKLYTAKEHYNDSTVLIIVPKNLDAKKSVDLVFWFHGWGNHVDSAAVRYELTKQFIESKRNAVLILAETAHDAPDSYGGKLENTGVFKALVNDVLQGLKAKQLIGTKCAAGHILLGGHSGAYRVMARILKNGQLPIDEVMLFDALYGETDKYMDWIKADTKHRFINLYTDHGGTFDETKAMVKLVTNAQISTGDIEETELDPQQLQQHNILFIHSLKQHNDIVNPDNFRLMLENEPFLKKL
jgi:hypothetical protein